ncbi:MAG: 3D domain-containing protein [Romboutsia sp.]
MIKKIIMVAILFCSFIFVSNTTDIYANSMGVVTTSKLNVRSGPSTKHSVIGSLSRNNSVAVLSSSQGWHKVRLSNNKEGWTSSKYIRTNSTSNNNTNNEKYTMNVVATAYTGYSTTSTGQKPVWGTIAVDPRVIPYGTKVYIPQFNQVFVANNTGGAIKGNKIDIFMNTRKECRNWGRRTIEIQVLK